MNGFPGGPPPRLALSLGDSLAGMFAAQGALAALYRRTVTGEGQVVDAALTESCLAVQESTIPDYDVGGVVRGPSGTRLEGIAPSNIYRTADGSWVVIAANQDTVFRRLCAAMGQPELATDDRFANHVARGRNQDELDKIIGDWAVRTRQPADIISTLSRGRGDQRTDQHRRRGRRRSAAACPRHDRRPLRRTDRPKRPGPRRGAGAFGDAREPSATPGPARPGQHNDEVYRGLLGRTDAELDALRGGGRDMTELPTHVDIREVSLRDGLQIEDPIPLSAKLELLAAVAATGVREMEATAFVSPSKVPALADAAELAAELAQLRPGIEFSALVASPNGAKRAIAAGLHSIEYVVSAADGHSRANVGRSTAESTALIAEIIAIAHDSGASVEVIIATAWDCPFDGPTPPQRVLDIVKAARDNGVDRLAIADTIGTTTPRRVERPGRPGSPAASATSRSARTSTTPAAPAWPARTPPSARVSPGSTRPSAGSAAARSPRARAATSPPRTWSICCGTAESTSTSTCRPRSPRPASRSASSATSCPARCCAPATGFSASSPCPSRRSPPRAARPGTPSSRRPESCSPSAAFTAPRWPTSRRRRASRLRCSTGTTPTRRTCWPRWPSPSCATSSTPSGLSLHLPDSPDDSEFFTVGGHRLLEHVQAEHRHHDRGRPAGRDPAAIRRRAERVPALRHGHRRRIGAARPGAGPRHRARPRTHGGGHRAAVRELHHGVRRPVRASGSRSATRTPSRRSRRSGRRRCTGSDDARGDHRGFRSPRTPSRPAGRDGRVHRGGDQTAGTRAHPVLRPAPRERPHRLGQRRHPAAGVGGPARRDAQARRQGGLAALRAAVAVRRPRRHQHRHGGDPGTPGAQGSRAAQRPAGRVVDRRQLPAGHHDGPVRHRRAEAGVDRGADHR